MRRGLKRLRDWLLLRQYAKVVVALAVVLTCGALVGSYALSYLERDPLSEVATMAIKTLGAIVSAYFGKSYLEKNSRNRWGVDRDGNFVEFEKGAMDERREI